jgi:hypothetical protein
MAGGRPKGTPQSAETRRKIGLGSRRAWKSQRARGILNRGNDVALVAFYSSPEGLEFRKMYPNVWLLDKETLVSAGVLV